MYSFPEQLFEKQITNNANKLFCTHENSCFTFLDIYNKIKLLQKKLEKLNLPPFSRIAISFVNEPDFIISYFAVLFSGNIVMPLSTSLTEYEINNILVHAGVSLFINKSNIHRDFVILKSSFDSTKINYIPEDLALIMYTSGTTGSPKGVMLTYKNIKAEIQASSQILSLSCSDSILGNLSLAHIFGQMNILWNSLYNGCTIHLLSSFEAEKALILLQEKNISILIAVPTMYQLMLRILQRNKYIFDSLRVCHSGAAPMPKELIERVETLFDAPFQEGYGLTETCSMAFSNPLVGIRKKGSVGLPIQNTNYILIDQDNNIINQANIIGEVCISGDIVSEGYWDTPPRQDKYLHTGDLGYKDEDNYLFLVDRKRDLIIRGGLKIYPREVEEVLLSHPLVQEVAVVGIKSKLQEEKPKAFIVLQSNVQDIQKNNIIEELKFLCSQKLASFKIPTSFEYIKHIPKTHSGKILKRELI